MIFFKNTKRGLLLCLMIALFSSFLVKIVGKLEIIGSPVIAILIGMLLSIRLKDKADFQEGINYSSKQILQYAVILLGFGLNLTTIGKVGLTSLPIIISTISVSFIVAYIVHRFLKVPSKVSILIGVGSSVCGGSAIAATAPVIDANSDEVAQSISVIFLFNIIAAIIFPFLGIRLGLSNTGFGLFAGTAINDTSSVTAAASTWDNIHSTNGTVLAYATIVKLTRTLAIIPITLVLSFFRIKKESLSRSKDNKLVSVKEVFPMFILYFLLASVVTTLIPVLFHGQLFIFFNNIIALLKQFSKFLIVMAMSAIGLNTDIIKLIKNGAKPIFMGFCCWISISAVSLLLQNLLELMH